VRYVIQEFSTVSPLSNRLPRERGYPATAIEKTIGKGAIGRNDAGERERRRKDH